MSRHNAATRRSLDYCPETCPAVDAAMERAKEVGTYRLREALTQACQDLIDAEDRGALALKGLARPVHIWSVRALTG